MATLLNTLLLEDNSDDAELILDQLRVAGFEPEWQRVETKTDYLEHLSPNLDLILADYGLPNFDGLSALQLLKASGLDIPFILVSGSIGEERAVAAMRDGASDYLLKDRLARLGQAVVHALEQKHLRVEKQRADEQLAASETRFRALIEHNADAIVLLDPTGTIVYVSPASERILGAPLDELVGRNGFSGMHPEDLARSQEFFQLVLQNPGVSYPLTVRYASADGIYHWIEATITNLVEEPSVNAIVANFRDVTLRKKAEQAEREQRTLAEALRDTAAALNSTLDFKAVLELIQMNARRVVPHDASTIMLLEGDEAHVVASRGFFAEGTEKIMSLRFAVAQTENLREIMWTGKPYIIPDVRTYPGWVKTAVAEQQRSSLCAPIRHKGKTIGFINLDGYLPDAFTSDDADHLLAFADQAAIALENARLFQETGLRLKQLEAINEVSSTLRQVQRLDEMLPLFLREVLSLVHASIGSIWLYDPVLDQVNRVAAQEWYAEMPLSVKRGEGMLGMAVESGQAQIARQLRTDPRTNPELRSMIPFHHGGAILPIRTAEQIVGVLFVVVELPRELTAAELSLLATLTEIAGNTIHRMRLFQETEKQVDRLASLRVIDQAISSSFDLSITLHVLLDQLTTRLGLDAASILLLNERTHTLEPGASRGFRSHGAQALPVRLGDGLSGHVALERKPLNLPQLAASADEYGCRTLVRDEGFAAYYGIPLVNKGAVIGVLELFQRTTREERPEWVDFVEAIAGQAAIAIDNASLFENLQRSNFQLVVAYDDTIEGWSRALDLRDKETEGHTQRVTELTMRLARAAGIGEEELVHVRRGSLLHDIGKMGVPDNILLKPGALTDQEWVIMRNHPRLAYEMLYPIVYLRPALDIPYCHHEKLDGTGYPRGLKGNEIPLAARVFAIVDVWDALRSDRPYRPAWSAEKTREHLRALAGTHLDPYLLELFLEMDEVKASGGVERE